MKSTILLLHPILRAFVTANGQAIAITNKTTSVATTTITKAVYHTMVQRWPEISLMSKTSTVLDKIPVSRSSYAYIRHEPINQNDEHTMHWAKAADKRTTDLYTLRIPFQDQEGYMNLFLPNNTAVPFCKEVSSKFYEDSTKVFLNINLEIGNTKVKIPIREDKAIEFCGNIKKNESTSPKEETSKQTDKVSAADTGTLKPSKTDRPTTSKPTDSVVAEKKPTTVDSVTYELFDTAKVTTKQVQKTRTAETPSPTTEKSKPGNLPTSMEPEASAVPKDKTSLNTSSVPTTAASKPINAKVTTSPPSEKTHSGPENDDEKPTDPVKSSKLVSSSAKSAIHSSESTSESSASRPKNTSVEATESSKASPATETSSALSSKTTPKATLRTGSSTTSGLEPETKTEGNDSSSATVAATKESASITSPVPTANSTSPQDDAKVRVQVTKNQKDIEGTSNLSLSSINTWFDYVRNYVHTATDTTSGAEPVETAAPPKSNVTRRNKWRRDGYKPLMQLTHRQDDKPAPEDDEKKEKPNESDKDEPPNSSSRKPVGSRPQSTTAPTTTSSPADDASTTAQPSRPTKTPNTNDASPTQAKTDSAASDSESQTSKHARPPAPTNTFTDFLSWDPSCSTITSTSQAKKPDSTAAIVTHTEGCWKTISANDIPGNKAGKGHAGETKMEKEENSAAWGKIHDPRIVWTVTFLWTLAGLQVLLGFWEFWKSARGEVHVGVGRVTWWDKAVAQAG